MAIRTFIDGQWEWIERDKAPHQQKSPRGKYIFFSSSRALLSKIAKEEIESLNFYTSSIICNPIPKTGAYVLYLYDQDGQKEAELALRYGGKKGIRYVGWKGDACTIDDLYKKLCINKNEIGI
jgi:hypothetical protein